MSVSARRLLPLLVPVAWMLLLVTMTYGLASPARSVPAAEPTSQYQTTAQYDIKLINLNPHVNKWHILELASKDAKGTRRFHLESINPQQQLSLSARGIMIKNSQQQSLHCLLWADKKHHVDALPLAGYRNPYFPLCEGLLYMRLPRSSNTKLSMTEWATEMLRKTSIGEGVINMVKPMLVNWEAEASKLHFEKAGNSQAGKPHTPLSAAVTQREGQQPVTSRAQLGISLLTRKTLLEYGQWFAVRMHPGIFASLFVPGVVDPKQVPQNDPSLYPLPADEADKLVYLIAYDLNRYSIAYSVGTTDPPIITSDDHQGVYPDWRESLVPIGSIPPYELTRAVGVFIGGFKQRHAVIRSGPHQGKSYGYIESGVELAPMAAGLASVYTDTSGGITIANWPDKPEAQAELRRNVVSARQNGTLIVEQGATGALVKNWREGNWSADAHGLRQSLRAGICIQEQAGERYLLFMAFTSATPSTMARVMRAYHCQAGMHLDMNAHMYLHNALYQVDQRGRFNVEYLNTEMLYPPGLKRHRFIMDNNHRDFFYVRLRSPSTEAVMSDGETPKKFGKRLKKKGESKESTKFPGERSQWSNWFESWLGSW